MKYNGKELVEMTPENWDGKSREMLVWDVFDTRVTKEKIIGYKEVSNNFCWMDHYGNLWKSCAEIPEEEKVETIEELALKTEELQEEIEELKETIESLKAEKPTKEEGLNLKVGKWYHCYAHLTVPNAVRSCYVPTAISGNFVFDGQYLVVPNASLIVKDNIVKYDIRTTFKYEPSMFDTIEELYNSEKKTRIMTHKELDEWLTQHKGVARIGRNVLTKIVYAQVDRNKEVSNGVKICGYDEDTWHEPMIEE